MIQKEYNSTCNTVSEVVNGRNQAVADAIQKGIDGYNKTTDAHKVNQSTISNSTVVVSSRNCPNIPILSSKKYLNKIVLADLISKLISLNLNKTLYIEY